MISKICQILRQDTCDSSWPFISNHACLCSLARRPHHPDGFSGVSRGTKTCVSEAEGAGFQERSPEPNQHQRGIQVPPRALPYVVCSCGLENPQGDGTLPTREESQNFSTFYIGSSVLRTCCPQLVSSESQLLSFF